MTDVVFETHQHIGVMTLERVQALNAINLPMIKAMQQQLLQWQSDDNVHAVVLKAAPGKAFCAGGDVRWLYDTGLSKDPVQMQFFWHEYRLNHFISQFSKPYIALMDGFTMGGGVGISMHGSHPVASERFVFAMPETGIGLFPDIGASYLLSRCPGHLGLYLALTGNRLGAGDTLAAGLVKHVIDADKFSRIIPELAEMDLSRKAYQQVSGCLANMETASAPSTSNEELEKINFFFQKSSLKDIMRALEQSDDAWALNTLSSLQQKSPLSLEVTFAQITRAKTMSLVECLKMDYCLVGHFMAGSDFYEGIRAALIDKDKMPRWQPAHVNQVTPANVANYFENCQPELGLINTHE